MAPAQTVGVLLTGAGVGVRAHAAMDLGAVLLAAACALWMRGRMALAYQVYTWASLVLILCVPFHLVSVNATWLGGQDLLLCAPRFLLPVFPLYVTAAAWARVAPWRHRLVFYSSTLGFMWLIGLLALGVVYS
jgi:hypothetical protein